MLCFFFPSWYLHVLLPFPPADGLLLGEAFVVLPPSKRPNCLQAGHWSETRPGLEMTCLDIHFGYFWKYQLSNQNWCGGLWLTIWLTYGPMFLSIFLYLFCNVVTHRIMRSSNGSMVGEKHQTLKVAPSSAANFSSCAWWRCCLSIASPKDPKDEEKLTLIKRRFFCHPNHL